MRKSDAMTLPSRIIAVPHTGAESLFVGDRADRIASTDVHIAASLTKSVTDGCVLVFILTSISPVWRIASRNRWDLRNVVL